MNSKIGFFLNDFGRGTAILLLSSGLAFGQAPGLPEGINDRFVNPNMEEVANLLEKEHPDVYDHRHEIVSALDLDPGMDVAEIGAGTGFIANEIARKVGSDGTVYAQEISQQALDHILENARREGISNIKPVLGAFRDTNLDRDSTDVIVTIRAYHHFEYPGDMLASIKSALRPDGRFVVLDHPRLVEDREPIVSRHIRASQGTVIKEILDAGFVLEKSITTIPGMYYLVFRNR